MKSKKETSWVDQKLKDENWKKGFEEEFIKLSIAEEIIRLRKAAGFTQKELAERIGSSASAISRYENTAYDRYEVQTLLKIANACNSWLKISFVSNDDFSSHIPNALTEKTLKSQDYESVDSVDELFK